MTNKREAYRRIAQVFQSVCDLAPGERKTRLAELCGDDTALRQQVLELLAEDDKRALTREDGIARHLGFALQEGDARDEIPLPSEIGRYRFEEKIGEGGMGSVYRARQDRPERDVAIKFLKSSLASPSALRRFELETQILGALQHPAIAQIHDAGNLKVGNQVRPYIAMELIDGVPLTASVSANRLDVRARLSLLAQICDAVHHAHVHGVIHRDLKPSNILVNTLGQPKILDFGIARVTSDDFHVSEASTRPGQLVGTLTYMSPEQARGESATVDARSDIYALGVIGFELLEGRVPFPVDGKPIHEAVEKICVDPVPTLTTVDRRLRSDVNTVLRTALAKEAGRRYASASEFAADIRRVLSDQPIVARPASTVYQLRKLAQRHRGLAAGLLLALFLLVLGTVTTGLGFLRAARGAEEANRISSLLETMFTSGDLRDLGKDAKIEDALHYAERSLLVGLEDSPRIEARLRRIISEAFRGLSIEDKALFHATRSREIFARELGTNAPETIEAMLTEGKAYEVLEDYEKAEERMATALARATRGSVQWLAVKARLARVLIRKQDYDRGVPMLREAVEAADAHGLLASPAWSGIRLQMAQALTTLNRHEEAEELCRATLKQLESAPNESSIMNARWTLAHVLRRRGQATEAAALTREVLEFRRRFLGPHHRSSLETAMSLAALRQEQRDLDGAKVLLDEVLQSSNTLGENDSIVLRARSILGRVHIIQGDFAAAEGHLLAAQKGFSDLLGEDSLAALLNQSHIGELRYGQGRTDESYQIHEQLIESLAGCLDEDAALYQTTSYHRIGKIQLDRKRLDEAEAALRKAYELRRRMAENHVLAAESALELGLTHMRQQRFEDAVPLLQFGVSIQEDTYGKDHVINLGVRRHLAVALRRVGREPEAIEILQQLIELHSRELGLSHGTTIQCVIALSRCYLRQGNYETACESLRPAVEALLAAQTSHDMSSVCLIHYGRGLVGIGEFELAETHLRAAERQLEPQLHRAEQVATMLYTSFEALLTATGRPTEADRYRSLTEALSVDAEAVWD